MIRTTPAGTMPACGMIVTGWPSCFSIASLVLLQAEKTIFDGKLTSDNSLMQVPGVVEREIHHRWIVLIDLNDDAMRLAGLRVSAAHRQNRNGDGDEERTNRCSGVHSMHGF
jgi:hypothetical protein